MRNKGIAIIYLVIIALATSIVVLPIPTASAAPVELVAIGPIYTELWEALKAGFTKWYKDKYGIDIKFSLLKPGGWPVCYDKVKAWGGKPDADVFLGAGAPVHSMLKKDGLTVPYKSPEAGAIPLEWRGWKVRDPDGYWYCFAPWIITLLWNPKVLEKYGLPPPKTYADLTKPIYRGHLVSCIPYASGTMHEMIEMFIQHFGEKEGWALARRLAANYGRFSTGSIDTTVLVQKGEYAIGLGLPGMNVVIARKAGFPVEAIPMDVTLFVPEAIAILAGAKHPEIAKIFVDWILSIDGQKAVMRGLYFPARVDIKLPDYEKEIPEAKMERVALGADRFWDIPEVTLVKYDMELAMKRWDEVNKIYEDTIYRKWDELKRTMSAIEEAEAELGISLKNARAAFDAADYAKARSLVREALAPVAPPAPPRPPYELYAAVIMAIAIITAAIIYRKK